MTLGEIIRQYRDEHGISTRTFASKSGLSSGYISMLEVGRNPGTGNAIIPSLKTLNSCARAMGISFDDLVSRLDDSQRISLGMDKQYLTSGASRHSGGSPSSRAVSIPVLGRVVAGIPLEAVEEILDWEEIPQAMAETGTYFALQVKGNSMEPRIKEGDVVIVRQQEDVESGDIAIVLVNGDEATVKRIKKLPNGIQLLPTNPAYDPLYYSAEEIETLPVRIIGKVVELRGKF